MFSRRKKIVIVKTMQQLNEAVKKKQGVIEVRGDLVKQIKWINKLSPIKIGALVALLTTSVVPSPIAPASKAVARMLAKSELAAITGGEIATIIFTSGISAALLLSILKGYSIEGGAQDKFLKLIPR